MKRSARLFRPFACLLMIVMLLAQSMPALAVSGSSSMASSGSKYVVTASYLNFRTGPGRNYGLAGSLKRGATVTYMGAENGWWKVRTSAGKIGYVDRQFLTPSSTSKTGSYFVNASKLRIRQKPNTSSRVVGTVAKGTMVSISVLNGDWGYLNGGAGVRGWVALKYLSTGHVSGSGSAGTYTVTADKLNVRKSGSASAKRIDSIKRGTNVRINETNGEWGKITYSKSGKMKDGWVKLSYLRAN